MQRASAYAPRMTENQYFSHLTAAQLLGLRLPEQFYLVALHVTSTEPQRAPRARGIIGHQARTSSTVIVNGMKVSDPVSTWLNCAAFLGVDELTVMGDGLVCRSHPAATLDQLRAAVRSWHGQRGFVRLQKALVQVRANTDSARETMLRLILERAGLPEPELNGAILNSQGAVIAHGDLVYRNYRVIVEYDGGQHRTDERQFDIDIERLDAVIAEGWRVIRVGRNLMRRHTVMVHTIRTALEAGGWTS
jgi:very-short-patch-repair endonuclease